MNYFNLLTMGR